MASIVTYDGGLKRVEFAMSSTERPRVIRLGRVSQKAAESFKAKIETIIADRLQARVHDPEVSQWLAKLDEKMLGRLRKAGLAEGVGIADVTLATLADRWSAARTCKPATHTFYRHTIRTLREFFGESRILRTITVEDADRWRAWLRSDQELALATVARRVKAARTIWRSAVRWKMTPENPFTEIKGGSEANDARKCFVSQETIERVIEAADDAEWKAIIALSRYGGLRCPSEHFALRWTDIDWENGRMQVTVPKLEHLEGHGQRIVPLFSELRPYLLALFTEAPEGSEYVIARYRTGCANLRTQFERILKRAGVTPWPRLFHALRASRETELMRAYDLATVCGWIGNSPAVAAKHYASSQDLDGDFKRAAGIGNVEAQEKTQRKAAESPFSSVPDADGDNPQPLSPSADGRDSPLVASSGNMDQWARRESNPHVLSDRGF